MRCQLSGRQPTTCRWNTLSLQKLAKQPVHAVVGAHKQPAAHSSQNEAAALQFALQLSKHKLLSMPAYTADGQGHCMVCTVLLFDEDGKLHAQIVKLWYQLDVDRHPRLIDCSGELGV